MKRKLKGSGGFTLVELVVVVVVLSLLALGAVMGLRGVQRNARIAGRQADASALVAALNNYNALVTDAAKITTVAGITGNADGVVILTAPARGTRPEEVFTVSFTGGRGQTNAQRRTEIESYIVIAPDTSNWRVNTNAPGFND
jgi:prepilin-type N-terminal cleavage/methylation domain-containing protein